MTLRALPAMVAVIHLGKVQLTQRICVVARSLRLRELVRKPTIQVGIATLVVTPVGQVIRTACHPGTCKVQVGSIVLKKPGTQAILELAQSLLDLQRVRQQHVSMSPAAVQQVRPRKTEALKQLVGNVLQQQLEVHAAGPQLFEGAASADVVDEVLNSAHVTGIQEEHRLTVVTRRSGRVKQRGAEICRPLRGQVVVDACGDSCRCFSMVVERHVHQLCPVCRRGHRARCGLKQVEQRVNAPKRHIRADEAALDVLADDVVVVVRDGVVIVAPVEDVEDLPQVDLAVKVLRLGLISLVLTVHTGGDVVGKVRYERKRVRRKPPRRDNLGGMVVANLLDDCLAGWAVKRLVSGCDLVADEVCTQFGVAPPLGHSSIDYLAHIVQQGTVVQESLLPNSHRAIPLSLALDWTGAYVKPPMPIDVLIPIPAYVPNLSNMRARPAMLAGPAIDSVIVPAKAGIFLP